MKKSKFLQNTKNFILRRFNPAKCKISLKLTCARVKLLRNKTEGRIKQMRKELAVLLGSGEDGTARIRVEHVIREVKMIAAYDQIELYCEILVIRLPIIETLKTIPIDLKEAITSLAFASPRCVDLPELFHVMKQFRRKYGKEFTERALELRPNSGVSSQLIENLSTAPPNIQTKHKVLREIAIEHNVRLDEDAFGGITSPPEQCERTFLGIEESITKRPSHVHPLLPEYDTFVQFFKRT